MWGKRVINTYRVSFWPTNQWNSRFYYWSVIILDSTHGSSSLTFPVGRALHDVCASLRECIHACLKASICWRQQHVGKKTRGLQHQGIRATRSQSRVVTQINRLLPITDWWIDEQGCAGYSWPSFELAPNKHWNLESLLHPNSTQIVFSSYRL